MNSRQRSLQAQATAILRKANPKNGKKNDGGWIPAKKAFDGREAMIDGKAKRRKRRWPGTRHRTEVSGGLPSLGKRQ